MKKKFSTIAVFILFIALVTAGVFFFKDRMYLLHDADALKEYILGFGNFSIAVFLLFQFFQVVIFFIPGEIIQIAAGYIYGPWIGFLLCIIGCVAGSIFNFFIGRILGQKAVQKWVSEKDNWVVEKIIKINRPENYKKLRLIIFIFYLIPGIPKDLLGYICGATSVEFLSYLILSTIGRIPAMLVSTIFGNEISRANWISLIIISLCVIAACVFSFVFIKKINGSKKEKFLQPLKKGNSLEIYNNDDLIFTSSGKWLYPLFELEDFLKTYDGNRDNLCSHDTAIGKGAAILTVRLGVKKINAELMSELAKNYLEKKTDCSFTYKRLVPKLMCKTETLLESEDDVEKTYAMLKERAQRT